MRLSIGLAAALSVVVSVVACTEETKPNPAGLTYQVVHGWPSLPPGTLLGQVSGVGIEANGDVLLFRRAEKDWFGGPISTDPIASPTVLRFDAATGSLKTSLDAATFAMPHGLTVDLKTGHLWVTDVALHQVFELDASGNVLRTLGERGVPGDDATHFYMPTCVAIASDGTFYVSDGYGNARVAKFSADGQFVKDWGTHGSGPGQFNVPHGIAIGPDGLIYVADRGNARVQIFDSDGNFKNLWEGPQLGRPWAIAFDSAGNGFIADGGDQPAQPPDRARIIEVDRSGGVITSFGSYGNQDGEMINPHALTVGRDGAVYVAEVGIGKRAQKFVKR